MMSRKLKLFCGEILIECAVYLNQNGHKSAFAKFLKAWFKSLLAVIGLRLAEVVSVKEHCAQANVCYQVIDPAREGFSSRLRYSISDPVVIVPLKLHETYVAILRKVVFYGDSNILQPVEHKHIVCDESALLDRGFSNIDSRIYRQRDRTLIIRERRKVAKRLNIEDGIKISGALSRNFYHQIYEILFTLLLLDKASIPDRVPLIVDEITRTNRNFKEGLVKLLVASNINRTVVFIQPDCLVKVNNLYTLSRVNKLPGHIDRFDLMSFDKIVYDSHYLNLMKSRLLKGSPMSLSKMPRKFFISRGNNSLRGYNEGQLLKVLRDLEIEVLDPARFSLTEQIALFRNAQLIVGASGAAFTNILFCRPKTRIVCLIGRKYDASTFSSLAAFVNADLTYIVGVPASSALHADFKISPVVLRDHLEKSIKTIKYD